MAKWLRAEDIPIAVRLPHIQRYQRQLRDALSNPTLTKEQRDDIKRRLRMLGQPRIYPGNDPADQTKP